MAVTDIKTLAVARDVDMVNTFNQSITKLAQMLSNCDPIKAHAGETLKQKHITGKLSEDAYTEGEDIPVSTYKWEDIKTFSVEIKPYRKRTTLQEVKKRGYEAAVDSTDAAMISDIQANIKKDFVGVLAAENTAVTGENLVATAATMWATLSNEVEDKGFGDVEAVFFVNPLDFATCIGKSEVFSAFGINYIEAWAGLGTLVSTSKVEAGTVYATVKQNIKLYTATNEGDEVFGFYTDETGYIAVTHEATVKNLCYDTVAYVGISMFAEYTNFVIKGTITPTV